ncbi:MAG: peptidoglycan-binding protein [Geminicoccaceae bacterium]
MRSLLGLTCLGLASALLLLRPALADEGELCASVVRAPPASELPAIIDACTYIVRGARDPVNKMRGLRYRGLAYMAQRDYGQARASLDQALQLEPADRQSLKARAETLTALGDRAGACADYQRLRQLEPGETRWRVAIDETCEPVPETTAEPAPAPAPAPVPPSPPAATDRPAPAGTIVATPLPEPPPAPEADPLVRRLQLALRDLGYTNVGATGVLGPQTRKAMAQLAPELGLSAGDAIDEATVARVEETVRSRRAAAEAAQRELVRRVQSALADLGYDIGDVDGMMGPRSRQALNDWARRHGHPPTEQPTEALIGELEASIAPPAPPEPPAAAEPVTAAGAPPPAPPAAPSQPVPATPKAPPAPIAQEAPEPPPPATPAPPAVPAAPAPAPAPAPAKAAAPAPSVQAAPAPPAAASPASGLGLADLTPNERGAVQRALALLGYWAGPADGQVSDELEASLRAYQRGHGAAGDGALSPPALLELYRGAELRAPPLPLPQVDFTDTFFRAVTTADVEAKRQTAMFYDPAFATQLSVNKDETKAVTLYDQAAQAGDKAAAGRLGLILAGSGRPAGDRREAMRWLDVAAHAGDPTAALRLAELLLAEPAAMQDRPRIAGLLQLAATGDATAGPAMALLRELGIAVE